MKEGFWGNYEIGIWFLIDEHERWLRGGNEYLPDFFGDLISCNGCLVVFHFLFLLLLFIPIFPEHFSYFHTIEIDHTQEKEISGKYCTPFLNNCKWLFPILRIKFEGHAFSVATPAHDRRMTPDKGQQRVPVCEMRELGNDIIRHAEPFRVVLAPQPPFVLVDLEPDPRFVISPETFFHDLFPSAGLSSDLPVTYSA